MNKKTGTVTFIDSKWILIDRMGRVYTIINFDSLELSDIEKRFYFKSKETNKCIVEKIC